MYYFHSQRLYNGMSYLAKDGKVYRITRCRSVIGATAEDKSGAKLYSINDWWDDFVCWAIRPSSNESHYLPENNEQAKDYAHAEALFEDASIAYATGKSTLSDFLQAVDAFTAEKMTIAWNRGHAEGYEQGVEESTY